MESLGFSFKPATQLQDVGPHTPASVNKLASTGNHGRQQGNIHRDVSRASPALLQTKVKFGIANNFYFMVHNIYH